MGNLRGSFSAQPYWLTQLIIFVINLPFYHVTDIMQGSDQNDSNCFNFMHMHRIRDVERIKDNEIDSPGILEGLRVGIVDEFNIEELDERNRGIQEIVI